MSRDRGKSGATYRGLRALAKYTALVAVAGSPALVMAGKPPKPPKPPPPPPPPPGPVIPDPTSVNGMQFFSWYVTGPDVSYSVSVNPSGTTTGTYVGTPFLTDANAAAVDAYLSSLPSGAIRAVKVENPGISNTTAGLIFNNTSYNVSYVFGDLEGANAQAMAANLVNQVKWVGAISGGTPTQSNLAWIGNYGFSALGNNLQSPAGYTFTGQHSFSGYDYNNYTAAGLNLSTPEVYPGSPSMRNLAAGDPSHGSGFPPNIRSNLFTLPLWRVGNVTDTLEKHGLFGIHQHIPWTANFNNWNNIGLDNDRDGSNGFLFVPGAPMVGFTDPITGKVYPAMTPAQTANQMVSQRDFATMILHMRLRGADAFHLLDSGIVGVTQQEMEQDAATGWLGEGSVNAIFAQGDTKLLIGKEPISSEYNGPGPDFSGGSNIIVNGQLLNVEQAGAIFSGAYSLNLKSMVIVVSNMDDVSKTVTLPSSIGGFNLQDTDFVIAAGTHLLIEFKIQGKGKKGGWHVASQHIPFTAISNNRSGFGIPEPGTLSLLAVAGVFGLNRRRRTAVR